MTTNIEFKKGILFIRVKGILVGNKVSKFEDEVIPILLGLEAKNVTINMYEVSLIDKRGLNSIIKLSEIVNNNRGKLAICEINEKISSNFAKSDVFEYCFKTKNELTSLGVFSI